MKALLEAYGVVLDRAGRNYYETVGTAFEDAPRALLKTPPTSSWTTTLSSARRLWTGVGRQPATAHHENYNFYQDNDGGALVGIELAPLARL